MIKGGTIDAALIAYGSEWYEEPAVRFQEDEPARHKIVDLTVRNQLILTHNASCGLVAVQRHFSSN